MQHDQDKHDLEEALEVARARGDRLDHARRLLDLGRYEVLHGDAAKARAHYQAAFALGRKAIDRANAKLGLGDLERLFGDRSAARAHYESALDLYRQGGDAMGEAHALHSLGDLERLFGDRSAARSRYESAMALYRKGGDAMGEAHALHSLGDLERLFGDVAGARAHYDSAKDLYHQGGDRMGEAHAAQSLGDLERLFGKETAASSHYEAAIELYRQAGDRMGEAKAVHSLGDLEYRAGNAPAARTHYEAAKALYRQSGDRMGEAHASHSLGDLERLFGDAALASTHYEAAIGLYRQAGDRMGEAHAAYDQGDLEAAAGKRAAALAHYEVAIELYRRLGDRMGEAKAVHGVGDLERVAGDALAARARYEMARDLYRRAGDRAGEAKAVHSVGDLENVLGDVAGARAHREAARELYRQAGDRLGEAHAAYDLGDLEREAGNTGAALSHYRAALDLYRQGGHALGESQCWYRLALVLREEGELAEALAHAREAVWALEPVRGALGNQGARRSLFVDIHDIYDLALQLATEAIRQGSPRAGAIALQLAESARSGSLAQTLRAGGLALESRAGELLKKVMGLEANLAAEPSPPRERAAAAEVLARRNVGIREELAKVRTRIGEVVSAQFARAFCPERPDVDSIRATLSSNGAHALIYDLAASEGSYQGHVVWAQPGGEVVAETVSIEAATAQFLSSFLADVARGGGRSSWLPAREAWSDLAKALLPEELRAACLDAALSGEPLDLVVVPDEICWSLPFGALALGLGTPLLAGTILRVVPTLGTYETLLDPAAPPAQTGGLAHLDPTLDTEREAGALKSLQPPYGPVTWASERQELYELLARGQGPYLLAFGAQGGSSSGLRQSLHLADGTSLSAEALLELRLPPVTSLGSCLAAGHAPLCLAVACLTRGTRCLISPLFATDDPAAGAILSEAYRNLAFSATPAEALRAAQLAYLADHPHAPPAIWASLVAIAR